MFQALRRHGTKTQSKNENKRNNNLVIKSKILNLPLFQDLNKSETDNRDEISETQHSSDSSSDDSALFEDVHDETYLPNETLETQPQSRMTLRPLQHRIEKNQINNMNHEFIK
ncbi:unnamed protein product, partial [Brenthis ino]